MTKEETLNFARKKEDELAALANEIQRIQQQIRALEADFHEKVGAHRGVTSAVLSVLESAGLSWRDYEEWKSNESDKVNNHQAEAGQGQA
jgi:predicted  nucleic acid-binding Zn-ribbon protein